MTQKNITLSLEIHTKKKINTVSWHYLVSNTSRKYCFDNNPRGLSSHNSETKTSAIIDQLNCLHVLQLWV